MVVKGMTGAWSRGWDSSHQIWIYFFLRKFCRRCVLCLLIVFCIFHSTFKLVCDY
ncbi:hypothetical protein SLEP1_g34457 [Rubroshorea leprosula]|uniref:Uncharacterized protein n=1 Tax=Rubroshorea leprosula TaxID=152421 RepID=A0AAV5KJX1_9ROSI|nr:hypothetical protein SLEP1_g34457 [Rubroshorea leprosula]